MKILIVGNGGREHALLWKLRRDAPSAEFYITRGSGGTAAQARSLPLDPSDVPSLAAWAEANTIDLTLVGPEAPLAAGIVDAFARRGRPVFGPSRAAAEIESSKAYAKALLTRAGVPTAAYAPFTELAAAERYIRARGAPIVVKASGLAAGKGALVCETVDAALAAARSMLAQGAFGPAGREIVVEERLEGEELSVFALADGEDVVLLLPAQDHKRVGEGDSGPNTGGMGAYAPVGLGTSALLGRVRDEILLPTVRALRDDGRPFRGLLYAGLMLTADGPRVIEYNARFGDPETEVVLPLLRSSLLEPLLEVARGGRLGHAALDWDPGAALTTVLASGGYPGPYESGRPITIPESVGTAEDLVVFHMGTRIQDGRLLTAGGRVLAVTALGPTIEAAAERSRLAAEAIAFEGKHFRGDIGWREIARRAGAA
jgi:phosphoribosylamine--glycine ligase